MTESGQIGDPVDQYFNIIFKSYFTDNPEKTINKIQFAEGMIFKVIINFIALRN